MGTRNDYLPGSRGGPSRLLQAGMVVVPMAGFEVDSKPSTTLITFALGSCVGLVVYDRVRKIGGLLHYMLPSSASSPHKAICKPGMFCDTGTPLLLERMMEAGARKEDLVVKVVGGGVINDPTGVFAIGRRNCLAIRGLLESWELRAMAWDVGGRHSRTVGLDVGSGRTFVRTRGREVEL